jgi:squalene-hopene/tetraprenyl-beta-curcumene cyclase
MDPGASAVSRRVLAARAGDAARLSARALVELQKPEGYWCGELRADSSLESDYILLQLWLHPPAGDTWQAAAWERIQKARRSILERQLPDGGFNIYPDGPSDVNATVKAYTALKLAGEDENGEPLRRARERVLALGGVQACNSYVKINLSLFGLYPRRFVPTIPPELVLMPGGVLYEMSSWTRAILVPLSIVQAKGGSRPVPKGFHIQELTLAEVGFSLPRRERISVFFHQLDRAFKFWERKGSQSVRGHAIREAEHWMLDRTRYSEGLGAIYPAMMYYIMALDALGYPEDHPDMMRAVKEFDDLIVERGDQFYFQPCFSPVWDTAIAMFALGELGAAPPDAMRRAADWIISKEVRHRGDWSVKRPDLEPSGWAFEFQNEHYPDIDDTAMVLLAFLHAQASDPSAQARCERRATNWLLNMQSRDGGFAAFDVDNDWAILNLVPFADHNAMLDPTCPDITGRVMECLCRRGFDTGHPGVKKAMGYLLSSQEKDGSWYGRWGVNYVYGTFLALRGLRAAGTAEVRPAVERAAEWLHAVQNQDGGWGESCASYAKDCYVPAPSTPSQTAWGLLGLLAAGKHDSPALKRGVDYLIATQTEGRWKEDLATGTGFPNVFYLSYTLYRDYFPLMALAQASRVLSQ